VTTAGRRLSRTEAGRDVVSASERLMAGLLEVEERCFARMADGLSVVAEELEDRVRARERAGGAAAVNRGAQGLLPAVARFEELLLPAVGDMLGTVRERTLVAVRRQLGAAESTLARSWAGTAGRAAGVAKQSAGRLESHWYEKAEEGLGRAVQQARQDMLTQAAVWWTRREPVDLLVRRWCQLEPVHLVGAHSRGVVWLVRARMNAHARNAGVALANGLTLAGITGWNEVTQESA
jgi:hypothetical protein